MLPLSYVHNQLEEMLKSGKHLTWHRGTRLLLLSNQVKGLFGLHTQV